MVDFYYLKGSDGIWGLLHKTLTGEKTRVKSEKSGKHDFIIDLTIGKKNWFFSGKSFMQWAPGVLPVGLFPSGTCKFVVSGLGKKRQTIRKKGPLAVHKVRHS